MNAVLITGSSGFIARHLIPRVAASGIRVHGLDLLAYDGRFGEYYQHFRGDIRHESTVSAAMQGTSAVIHLAAAHHDFGVRREEYFDVNDNGMQVMLDVATRLHVDDFLFYSTVAVYGCVGEPTHESLTPSPNTPYGRSKWAAEQRLRRWQEASPQRRAILVRPTVVFGPYNLANMYTLIHSIANGRYIRVGKGTNVKSIAYVENLAEATLFLRRVCASGTTTVNYADSPHLTSAQIVQTIAEALGKPIPRLAIPRPIAYVLATPLDAVARITHKNLPITSSRIRKLTMPTPHYAPRISELGFVPLVSTVDGLKKMVEWYMRHALSASLPC